MSEPKTTGRNIYGETMAEYYQRRTHERGAIIERARGALLDLADALEEHGGDHHDDDCPVCVAIARLREALRDV